MDENCGGNIGRSTWNIHFKWVIYNVFLFRINVDDKSILMFSSTVHAGVGDIAMFFPRRGRIQNLS
jgi:hypothetical protein